jgi:hypothetical protein
MHYEFEIQHSQYDSSILRYTIATFQLIAVSVHDNELSIFSFLNVKLHV